jgi:hypothetical protein
VKGTLREQLGELLAAIEPSPVPMERIRRRALGIRLRRTGAVASVLAAAGLAAVLLTGSHAPISAPVPPAGGVTGPGVPFAHGVAGGRPWRLAVQDIADPGDLCVPGVTIDGSDADPIGPSPGMQTAVGNPAFITLGAALPGTGVGFVQVPPGIGSVSVLTGGFGGGRTEAPVRTVIACGERFHLAGFAYPLTAPVRLDAGTADVAISAVLSDPQGSEVSPDVTGVWQNLDASYGQPGSGTLAAGDAYGASWSIGVQFGAAGDCYRLTAEDALSAQSWSMGACGPVSTPSGLATIMALPLGFGGGHRGTGYATLVSPATAGVVAWLSDGSTTSAVPCTVAGRRYAALFVPGSARVTRLSWLNAAGQPIATTTSVNRYGVTQFQP